jgi:3-dehydroquinate synthetase
MTDITDTTSLEKTSLEAHVDLCALRYGQLDARLSVLETKMDQIQQDIIEGSKSLKTVLITVGGGIVSSVIGLIVTLLLKF